MPQHPAPAAPVAAPAKPKKRGLRRLILPTLSPQRLALAAAPALAQPRAPVRTPDDVCARESFVGRRTDEGALALVDVGPSLAGGWRAAALQRFAHAARTPASRYLVAVHRGSGGGDAPRVHLWYAADAGWRECILGFAHALHIAQRLVEQGEAAAAPAGAGAGAGDDAADVGLVADGALFLDAYGPGLIADLEHAGWWVGQPMLEQEHGRRLHI